MTYREKDEKGLCVVCGGIRDNETKRCSKCRQKGNNYIMDRYKKLQLLGICPVCGKNRLFDNESVCIECRAKNTINMAKVRARRTQDQVVEFEKKRSNYSKKNRQYRIENRLCVKCGKKLGDAKYKTCNICLLKEREWKHNDRIKKGLPVKEDMKEKDKGICYFCDNPALQDMKVCEKHHSIIVESRKKLNNKNHIWRDVTSADFSIKQNNSK